MFTEINWKIIGNTGHLIINRPPSNILTMRFFEELSGVLDIVRVEKELRMVLVYG